MTNTFKFTDQLPSSLLHRSKVFPSFFSCTAFGEVSFGVCYGLWYSMERFLRFLTHSSRESELSCSLPIRRFSRFQNVDQSHIVLLFFFVTSSLGSSTEVCYLIPESSSKRNCVDVTTSGKKPVRNELNFLSLDKSFLSTTALYRLDICQTLQ